MSQIKLTIHGLKHDGTTVRKVFERTVSVAEAIKLLVEIMSPRDITHLITPMVTMTPGESGFTVTHSYIYEESLSTRAMENAYRDHYAFAYSFVGTPVKPGVPNEYWLLEDVLFSYMRLHKLEDTSHFGLREVASVTPA